MKISVGIFFAVSGSCLYSLLAPLFISLHDIFVKNSTVWSTIANLEATKHTKGNQQQTNACTKRKWICFENVKATWVKTSE